MGSRPGPGRGVPVGGLHPLAGLQDLHPSAQSAMRAPTAPTSCGTAGVRRTTCPPCRPGSSVPAEPAVTARPRTGASRPSHPGQTECSGRGGRRPCTPPSPLRALRPDPQRYRGEPSRTDQRRAAGSRPTGPRARARRRMAGKTDRPRNAASGLGPLARRFVVPRTVRVRQQQGAPCVRRCLHRQDAVHLSCMNGRYVPAQPRMRKRRAMKNTGSTVLPAIETARAGHDGTQAAGPTIVDGHPYQRE